MKAKKIMSVLLSATFGLLLLLVSPETSQAVPFDMTAPSDDFGVPAAGDASLTMSTTGPGLTLMLTALQDIDFKSASLETGLATDVTMSSEGTGVNGSAGISGKGAHMDEALKLYFSTEVLTDSFVLNFSSYEKAKDHALIYIYTDPVDLGSSVPTLGTLLDDAIIEDNLIGSGTDWTLKFSDPDLGLSITSFDTLYVRNTGDEKGAEFFVSGLNATAVPEPATMLLLGSGLVGIAVFRRKFRRG